ncbi:3-oxoacyl-acyl-carrier-protein synthase-1 [Mucilaginibacter xinganensis]|uniref:3-oxoacyl-acyl-carrier-protein synthase-1 n=2 Tax=Mucilaginibacter xinganensis TaxID=1234841 RepID=A0A223NXK7_9SPHI|nr:3-oxoacyl-acyl-carrier-protein synthase-1 [Mucilaginibacter xinganensis]
MSRASEQDVFVVADNIYSPLGKTTAENFQNLKNNVSGVQLHNDDSLSPTPLFASIFSKDTQFITCGNGYTKFEQLLIASLSDVLILSGIDPEDKKTVLIISTTKGNISLLETETNSSELQNRVALTTSAKLVAKHFGFSNRPVIISNACISGIMSIITGMRLLRSARYETAVIVGADVISRFIVSGFQSFQALSVQACKPFDKDRNGLNLGEGAAAIVLSTNKKFKKNIKVKGGSVSNDANHISGPSRTGKELGHAIEQALRDANLIAGDVGFISAHGTATVYNDEMEANAIGLTGLQSVPLNSLKGYYGHTLGAAGLIESVISIHSLKENWIIPTLGFDKTGVTTPVNVCTSPMHIDTTNFLKTASGFGGCNAAVVFGK